MYNQHVVEYYNYLSEEVYGDIIDPINFYKSMNEEWSQEIYDYCK